MNKFKWYDKELIQKVHTIGTKAVAKACFMVEGDAKISMKPGSGKEYPRLGGKIHTASAPGQPPAVDSGRLRASISSNWTGSGMANGKVSGQAKSEDGVGKPTNKYLQLIGVVGTNVEYARALELGYEPRNLKPRPYLRPALHRNEKKIEKMFKNIL